MNNVSVYLHIPFCRQKCLYCDFFSRAETASVRDAYVTALCAQIRAFRPGEQAKTVYIGGGTPSVLTPEQMKRIFDALRSVFLLSPDAEITVEMNPDSVTPELLHALRDCGVNRISLGAQSFCDTELRLLGRLHNARQITDAVGLCRDAGLTNIGIDLMLGIPEQTEQSLSETLQKAAELALPHLSVYLLKIERNTPFFSTQKEFPEETQEAFYLQVHDFLTARGYEHYEISNFAKPDFRSRHNTNYWLGGTYAAFGAGAHGYLDGKRFFYPQDTEAFIRANGDIPPTVTESIDDREAQREHILLGLRLADGIPLSDIPEQHAPFIRQLCANGLAGCADGHFFLTPRGFLVSNAIIGKLLSDGDVSARQ